MKAKGLSSYLLLSAIHLLYLAGYLALFHFVSGKVANMLAILPPAIAALLWGIRLGISSYTLCVGLMAAFNLYYGTGAMTEGTTLFGCLALLAVVVTLGRLRDIGDALKSEVKTHRATRRALEGSEAKYRSVVERAADGIAVITDGVVHFANPKMADMLGYAPGDMTGEPFLTFVHPSHQERIERLLEALPALEPSASSYTLSLRHKSGRKVSTELGVGTVPNGEGDSALLIIRDVSTRYRMLEEKALLEEQLQRSQKLESLGRLAGGVAHDINNILSTIMNSATILADEIDRDQKIDIENIFIAAKRGGALTKDLLGFARKGKFQKRVISINDVIHKTLSLLAKTIPKNIEIISRLDLGVTYIEGDPEQLEHALMNVLLNAVDALAGRRGTIRVRTGEITAIVRREGSPDPVELGRRVYVDISDDGCGMRNEVLVNAFEPFFTTKDPGDGAGLGLSMVYGTVRNHGGNIEIASEEGAGTGVKLTFPLYEGGAPPKEEYLGSIPPDPESRFDEHVVCGQASKPGCILVVDDEETLRQTTRRFLKSQGYEVLVADTGRKAIKVFERARDRIQVILLDMIMPVMDGFDTFYELKRRSLNAEVILISGFCADDKVEQMVMDGAFGFLQKPVDPHVLSYELYRAQRFHQNKPDPKAVN